MRREYVVIVDGYSSGRLLAPLFAERGYSCVHVQSSGDLPAFMAAHLQPGDFAQTLIHAGSVDDTAVQLPKPVKCVMPGSESGVTLADALSENLGVATNGTELSFARRNKFSMAEAVRRAGLRTARQFKSADPDAVVDWWRTSERGGTVVVKPLDSAGTEGVHVCTAEKEIRDACTAILGHVNRMGSLNREVLIQEFLRGTEYIINTVSAGGRHMLAAVYVYAKVPNQLTRAPVYDYDLLMAADNPLMRILGDYVFAVLDALGIRHGPAHAEVMLSDDGRPVLVEIGARLDGVVDMRLERECFGTSIVDLAVDAFIDPEGFTLKRVSPLAQHQAIMYVHFLSQQSGTVAAIPGEVFARSLPSFYSLNLRVGRGDVLRPTTDLFTSPGFMTLRGQSVDELMEDYRRLREHESLGSFFAVASQ